MELITGRIGTEKLQEGMELKTENGTEKLEGLALKTGRIGNEKLEGMELKTENGTEKLEGLELKTGRIGNENWSDWN